MQQRDLDKDRLCSFSADDATFLRDLVPRISARYSCGFCGKQIKYLPLNDLVLDFRYAPMRRELVPSNLCYHRCHTFKTNMLLANIIEPQTKGFYSEIFAWSACRLSLSTS